MSHHDIVLDALAADITSMLSANGNVGGDIDIVIQKTSPVQAAFDNLAQKQMLGLSAPISTAQISRPVAVFTFSSASELLQPKIKAAYLKSVRHTMQAQHASQADIDVALGRLQDNGAYLKEVLREHLSQSGISLGAMYSKEKAGGVSVSVEQNLPDPNSCSPSWSSELEKLYKHLAPSLDKNYLPQEQKAYAQVLNFLEDHHLGITIRKVRKDVEWHSFEVADDYKEMAKRLFNELAERGVSAPKKIDPILDEISQKVGSSVDTLKQSVRATLRQ